MENKDKEKVEDKNLQGKTDNSLDKDKLKEEELKQKQEEVKEKVELISDWDALEKAEDLGDFLKDKKNIVKQEDDTYVVSNKYLLSEEEHTYFYRSSLQNKIMNSLLMFNLSVWLVLLGLTIFSFIVAYISARIDSGQIRKKWGRIISLNHTTRVIIRVSIFALLSFLFYKNIYNFILSVAYQWFLCSLIFDLLLNKLRGNNIWYIGVTADFDKLARKHLGINGGDKYALIKLIFIIFIIICIVITNQ